MSGLADEDVQELLREVDQSAAASADPPRDDALAGARDYLTMLESRARYHTEPLALGLPAAAAPRARAAPEPTPAAAVAASPGEDVIPAAADAPRSPETAETSRAQPLWHRIPLGDEAELVISDRVYGRHRDRIDWLVRWARKVFG
jgi:hypothetical protein